MLQLFVAPTPFEGWGERAYDGTSQRQLLAVLIVSVGALALTLCGALLVLLANEPLGPWQWLATVRSCFRYLISQMALWLTIQAVRPPTVS